MSRKKAPLLSGAFLLSGLPVNIAGRLFDIAGIIGSIPDKITANTIERRSPSWIYYWLFSRLYFGEHRVI